MLSIKDSQAIVDAAVRSENRFVVYAFTCVS